MKTKIISIASIFFLLTLLSCEREEKNTPPDKPIPLDGESYTCEVLRPTLEWSSRDNDLMDELSFTLMFGESPDNLIVQATNLYSSEYTFDHDLSASSKYYWQIIVSDGKSKTIGDIWEFTTISNPIESKVPSTPCLISPKKDISAGNVVFNWKDVTDDGGIGNIKYILRVNGVEYEVLGTPSKTINLLAGNCEWYVTAYDKDGNAAESEHIKINLF